MEISFLDEMNLNQIALFYCAFAAGLFVIMSFYLSLARKCKIVDEPNNRSSHKQPTLRGGGIIYWFSILIYMFCFASDPNIWVLFSAFTLSAIISFIDDVFSIPPHPRLFIHFVALTLVFFALGLFSFCASMLWILVVAYVIFVGVINAFNFMDGINGMLGLTSLVTLSAMQYVNLFEVNFVNPHFIWFPIVASIVFCFFNCRKKAICFAGDIGGVTLAFWTISLMILMMEATNSIVWILFLAVYGVETVCTIFHRMFLRQNIFLPHRIFLFQILVNEYKLPHVFVSGIYAFLQLIACVLVIFLPVEWYWLFLIVLLPLVALYCSKFYLLKKIKSK